MTGINPPFRSSSEPVFGEQCEHDENRTKIITTSHSAVFFD
jgi:hypothetical protein